MLLELKISISLAILPEIIIQIGYFLPRDAMHKRGLCRHAVYVCLCVCHVRGSCQNE